MNRIQLDTVGADLIGRTHINRALSEPGFDVAGVRNGNLCG